MGNPAVPVLSAATQSADRTQFPVACQGGLARELAIATRTFSARATLNAIADIAHEGVASLRGRQMVRFLES
jgi:hypothetical protein